MVFALSELFNKRESLISVDIGASAIKLLEFELGGEKPRLVNVGVAPLAEEVFTGHVISKSERLAERISGLLESTGVSEKRVATAVPGPSVFIKKVKMPKQSSSELAQSIQFEAANLIPHSIDAVRIDFHVVGASGKNQLEVLIAACKNDVANSFIDTLGLSGLETAVLDIDYFAAQNMFELSYPESVEKTVAIVNLGHRYSSINICRSGESLFTGDISLGGRGVTEAIMRELNITPDIAEEIKCGKERAEVAAAVAKEVLDRNVEQFASEFNRQLSFFWNASGAESGIDLIALAGGTSQLTGLVDEITEKTGIETMICDPFRGVECADTVDPQHVREVAPLMGICVGMGLREPGDRIEREF